MSYLFLERHCKVTANLPGTGIVTITGWIKMADEHSILITDEYHNNNRIMREQLIGSIVVLFEQPIRSWEINKEQGVMEVGR